MLEKFGRSLILLIGVYLFVRGAEMLVHISDPVTRTVSASLADAISAS